ncbi:MAG: hypothetical protein WCT10_04990 [Patescibacteria group bacterium]
MDFLSVWHKKIVPAAPYLSEFGAVVFTAAAIFGFLAAVGEFLEPGFAINYVSPKGLLAVLAASGGLALVPGRPVRIPNRAADLRRLLLAAVIIIGSAAAAWYYFGSLPQSRIWLMAATAVTVGAVLRCAASRPGTGATNG